MKKTTFLFYTLFVFIFSLSLSANRDDPYEDIEKKGACRSDYEKFCRDTKPGKGRIAACLRSHEHELSQQCKNHIEKSKEKSPEFRKACRSDAEKFCKGARTGNGRIISCLKSNSSLLSEQCRSFVQEKK